MCRFQIKPGIRKIFLLCGLFFYCISLCSQAYFLELDHKSNSYKKILSDARSRDRLVFICLFVSGVPLQTEVLPAIGTFVRDANFVSDVVDLNFDWNHPLRKRISILPNPTYLIVHPDDIILAATGDLSSEIRINDFFTNANKVNQEYNSIVAISDKSKPETLQSEMIFYKKISHSKGVENLVNDYLKKINSTLTEEQLRFLVDMALFCPCTSRLKKTIYKNEERIIQLMSLDTLYKLREGFIEADLKSKGLYEPPYVWARYEDELGLKADSLYRLFAIDYFQNTSPDPELLLNEIFDFLSFYPDSPWETQDNLFEYAIIHSRSNEDFAYLLDLISYQVQKSENFRNLDFRAYLLYKLGQTERALSLLERVNELAIIQGIRYRSLLSTLK